MQTVSNDPSNHTAHKPSKKQHFRTNLKAAKSRVKRLVCVGRNLNVVDP